MTQSFKLFKINLIYAILIIIQIHTLLGQTTYSGATLRNELFQVLEINNRYKFNYEQLNKIFWLNLFASQPQKSEYYIIQIDFYSQDPSSKIKACLNFQQQNIQQNDNQNCQITDFDATNEKLSQHLLVIKKQDVNLQSNKIPFLVIYEDNLNSMQNQYENSSNSLEYEISIYFSNSYPCHNNCHGLQGMCNSQYGTCACKQNYIGSDCSVQLNPLALLENINITNTSILNEEDYFKIEMDLNILHQNNNVASLFLQAIQNPQNLKIFMLFNDYEMPSETNYHFIFEMTSNQIIISNLENLCKQKIFNPELSNPNVQTLVNIFAKLENTNLLDNQNKQINDKDNENNHNVLVYNNSDGFLIKNNKNDQKQNQVFEHLIIALVSFTAAIFICVLVIKMTQVMIKKDDQQESNKNFQIISKIAYV
ncbi:transmembrane protein, putative (macronuclear) [Tetrahymena thermophila SB210]|uniref:Transmembrane protein, putative n=1 Tax=Tetrahymena thermophila (strain SB210) TaxID=312017 RepID=I7MAW5_TETTS|nr:transmembrane protein, putative [Tetrahymena thermophila SB210]EAS06278.2 transmembrane protein, putative [Tetrahymena thermophila SB210]|eukprot:XP_001026523.2 transmembrane protein, putative [Tetrahymena thermophila SB210]